MFLNVFKNDSWLLVNTLCLHYLFKVNSLEKLSFLAELELLACQADQLFRIVLLALDI